MSSKNSHSVQMRFDVSAAADEPPEVKEALPRLLVVGVLSRMKPRSRLRRSVAAADGDVLALFALAAVALIRTRARGAAGVFTTSKAQNKLLSGSTWSGTNNASCCASEAQNFKVSLDSDAEATSHFLSGCQCLHSKQTQTLVCALGPGIFMVLYRLLV